MDIYSCMCPNTYQHMQVHTYPDTHDQQIHSLTSILKEVCHALAQIITDDADTSCCQNWAVILYCTASIMPDKICLEEKVVIIFIFGGYVQHTAH